MKLAGIAACVPKTAVKASGAYAKFPKLEVDRVIANTGVLEKREAKLGTTSMDLCLTAARPLLEELGWDGASIDAIVFVTSSPDYIMPATSHRAQHELGLGPRSLVFDINLGCSGYTHGLILIEGFIRSGLIRRALMLCGDVSPGTFRPNMEELEHRSDLGNVLLFGDAGTATALCNDGESQVHARAFGADGTGAHQIYIPGGWFRQFWSPEVFERGAPDAKGDTRRPLDLILRGAEVLNFSMKRVPPLLNELFEQAAWTREDVDAFVMHQANKFMLDYLARRLKLPTPKVLMTIEHFGNTTSASIPLTMLLRGAEYFQRRSKWALLGFGVGLSWSGVMLETDSIASVPLIEV